MSESTRRIAQLQRELAANPASRQFYQLGELLRRDGRSVEAAEALRAGLAHHPRYVAAWVALGRACLDAGQVPEAVHGLEQALALDSQNPVAWRLLGEAYLAFRDRPAALDAMRHSLELVPGDDVLQAAVDALTSELGAGTAAAPAGGGAAPPESPIGAGELPPPPEHASPAVEPAVPLPLSTTTPAPPAARPLPVAEVFAQVVPQQGAEDLFGEPPYPLPPPEPASAPVQGPEPVAAAPAEPAPPPAPTADADLFLAPEAEEAPVLLRRVLEASAEKVTGDVLAQPPASLTLARLYVQQQALGEAVSVLERLLEREPYNIEARDLLALVRDMMEPLPAAAPALTPRERKIATLQRWLASLTLGRERATR